MKRSYSIVLVCAVTLAIASAPTYAQTVIFKDDFQSDAATLRVLNTNPLNDFDPVIGTGDVGGTWYVSESVTFPEGITPTVAPECVVQVVNNTTPWNWSSGAGSNKYIAVERTRIDNPFPNDPSRLKGGVRVGDLDAEVLTGQILELKASVFVPTSVVGATGLDISGWNFPDDVIPSEEFPTWYITHRAFGINFAPDGYVYYYDGQVWPPGEDHRLSAYTKGAWQDITLSVNLAERTFFLDVEGSMSSGFWWDQGADVIQSILFNPDVDNVKYALDNVQVSYYAPPPPIPGDANNDRYVNETDAGILAENWLAGGATWAMGDFNGDFKVDDADATLMAANWGRSPWDASAAVPEPSALALLLVVVASGLIYAAKRAG